MAIDLLNSFLKRETNISSNSKNTSVSSSQNLPQNLQVMRAVRSLQAGQTIRGEILSVNGEEVQLAILKDVVIEARLEQSMNLTCGTTMPFQVKANHGNSLSLVPLFTNTTADPNVLKALEMAKIPINERSMEMVQTLMEKGMPIDKHSLSEIYRDVTGFKEAGVKDIISLHQMKIPVTQENLEQLSLYENNRHYITDTFEEMGKAFSGQIENWMKEGKEQEIKNLLQDLQKLFSEGKEEGTVTFFSEGFREKVQGGDSLKESVMTEDKGIQQETAPETITEEEDTKPVFNHLKEDLLKDPEKENPEIAGKKLSLKTNENWDVLLKETGKEKNIGKFTKLFEKVWKEEAGNQWLMEPEALLKKKEVKEYYSRLNHQMKQLEKIAENHTGTESAVSKVTHNTVSNLEFMNQLNHMHAYIQLPLKMANQNAHGELYVFTNKRNMTKQEGKVSALLHLDMESLGKLDVYVALEEKKVTTNFYLEKEEYLDFLEEHMELLTDRLNNRGYECTAKAALQNHAEEPLMKLMEKQTGQQLVLSTQAFDVRA